MVATTAVPHDSGQARFRDDDGHYRNRRGLNSAERGPERQESGTGGGEDHGGSPKMANLRQFSRASLSLGSDSEEDSETGRRAETRDL